VIPYKGEERREPSLELGRLIQAVETLTIEVGHLRNKMETVEGHVNRGKGMLLGMTLAAGGIGASISSALHKMFSNPS